MSKTYRKVVAFTDYSRHHTRWAKRQASKAVRRTAHIDDGNAYRKVFSTYDIHDYKFCYYATNELEGLKASEAPLKECSPWAYRTYETIRKMT